MFKYFYTVLFLSISKTKKRLNLKNNFFKKFYKNTFILVFKFLFHSHEFYRKTCK